MSFLRKLKCIRCQLIGKLSKSNINIGKKSTWGRGTVLYAPNFIDIGNNVYIGKYCSLETDIRIGNDVLIGNNVGLIGKYDHDYLVIGSSIKDSPWIGDDNYNFKGKGLMIDIGNDVWIGYGCIILSGVKIGAHSIIAAGSVVTKNIPENSIAAGNPCIVIKNRFSKEDILKHKKELGQ